MTTVKCESVAHATLLSRSEQLARAAIAVDGSAAAEMEGATGEPDAGRHNNELFVLEQMCLVSVTNMLLSDSRAPSGCRRANRMQAGRPGAGRKMQLHIICTQT